MIWPRFGERELLSLPDYEAVARVTGAEGTQQLGRLAVPRPGPHTECVGERVRFLTRARVGRPREEVELELLERLGWSDGEAGPD